MDYEPIDISEWCRVDSSTLGNPRQAGARTFRGVPFVVGREVTDGGRVIGLGDALSSDVLTIPLNRRVQHLVFAHFMVDSPLRAGDGFGVSAATYVFRFASSEPETIDVREGFEIGVLPATWMDFPILAWSDLSDGMQPRDRGPWTDFGIRQMEVRIPYPEEYYLWPWQNPHPDEPIVEVEIRPSGPRFVVGAVTASYLEEEVFCRSARRTVQLEFIGEGDRERASSMRVEVDRGPADFPWRCLDPSRERELVAWGEPPGQQDGRMYVDVAAKPSATVAVFLGDESIGEFGWGALDEEESLQPNDRVTVSLVDEGRNWVRTRIVDEGTGEQLPCRIRFVSDEGVPYQPAGHQQHVAEGQGASELPGSWPQDLYMGGDVRLGAATYAYLDGSCEGWLPRGRVTVEIARGFEYEPVRRTIDVDATTRELTFELRRIANMKEERYFSGDTHVHGLSTQGGHLEAAGEGLNVINLLALQLGHTFAGSAEFTGTPTIGNSGETIVFAGQEPRQHVLGHISVLGISKLLAPWASGGPDEGELGGNLETTMSRWADECHSQGGTVIVSHMPFPHGEFATLIATERVDGVEWLIQSPLQTNAYYRCLNLGYRLPLVGGTDKISADIPVGIYRTYVHIADDEPFTYENWCAGLRSGNTFLSGGPLISARVEGQPIGSDIALSGKGGTVEVEGSVRSAIEVRSLEIVVNGAVVASVEGPPGTRELSIHEYVPISENSWIALRCGGAPYFESVSHYDFYERGVIAHTSPFYVSVGGPWRMFDREAAIEFRNLIQGGIDYVAERSPQWSPGTITHHHGMNDHMAFLLEPFLEAMALIDARLRSGH